MKRKGIIFILSSPSGGGKTTLLRMVRQRLGGLIDSISYTTRPRRPDEKDGADYHFIDEKEFRERIGRNFFAEWARVYDHHYGTSREDLAAIIERGDDAIMDIDVQGARQMKSAFAASVTIYILPPSFRELENRLRGRGTDDDDTVRKRMTAAAKEMESLPRYDYFIVNRDLSRSAAQMEAIITAERLRASRYESDQVISSIIGG